MLFRENLVVFLWENECLWLKEKRDLDFNEFVLRLI